MKRLKPLTNQSGATAVIVAISIVALVGFTALAIDIGNLLMVRNQLQNAADSGALAGAAVLYDNNGTSVNDGANQVAYDMATSNAASSTEGEIPVEVNWEEGNEGDVQRGHWSFETRTFTPNDTLLPTDLWDYTTDELDTLDTFINAVRVKTRRESAPAASFFAGIFGYDSFTLSAEAVAYLGFAGKLKPGEVDQPIAICTDSIKQDDEVSCNIGRMINSSTNSTTSNTGGWTDFNQEDNPCSGTNSNDLKELTCNDSGNPDSII
ncbi:MAG: TadG family pilus assembly protein, partial [Desulfurivibrionaceae bacterium]